MIQRWPASPPRATSLSSTRVQSVWGASGAEGAPSRARHQSSTSSLAAALMVLVLISSACYAALYVLIGVVFSARATVVAVVYTLLLEGVLSSIPATINKFTVCYRLRALLAEWVELDEVRSAIKEFFGYEPVWQHLAYLALYTTIVLTIALVVVRYKEFPVNTDT